MNTLSDADLARTQEDVMRQWGKSLLSHHIADKVFGTARAPETLVTTFMTPRTIVALCGSTRFLEGFRQANLRETLQGKIVLTIGCDFKSGDALGLTEEAKRDADLLHLDKIAIAHEILVVNELDYIGESTAREIRYARLCEKRIRFMHPHHCKGVRGGCPCHGEFIECGWRESE